MIAAELSSPLILLALLACPIGMGVMMWVMARGVMGVRKPGANEATEERSLHELKAEQARLAEKMEALGRRTEAQRDAKEPAASSSRTP